MRSSSPATVAALDRGTAHHGNGQPCRDGVMHRITNLAARTRAMPTLAEFLAEHSTKRRCWACSLPDAVRGDLESAKGEVAVPILVRWLHQEGHADATSPKLHYHFSHVG